MHADRFHLVMDVFRAASEVPRAERAPLLVQRCAGDDELRAEVEALLEHADWTGGLLQTGAGMVNVLEPTGSTAAPASRVQSARDADDALPVLSGEYRIIRLLGEGGMGAVYEAEQLLPRRLVAVKAIRRGLGTRRMLRRFEMEMNILGRLQHPGIAQIYDAGAADEDGEGDAYFVMELVRGKPLSEHARGLSIPERLELMARVCDAVQHAHQRGVIHRDLKPGNILIAAAEDSIGQPKILDFGVARIADAAAQLGTVDASPGQVVGTLAYMSPEQVAPDRDEVDVRSDVYSLGVVLYLSLAGRYPIDLQGKSIPDALRSVREVIPEPLGGVNPECRGEIETIVAKAIEKDKSRRYQSAEAFGEDLRRYLRREPIEARRDSTLYVLRKRAAMHKTALGVAGLALASAIGFLFWTSAQADRNRRLAEGERAAREQATAALEEASAARARADREAAALRDSLYLSHIHLAQAAYAAGDADRMRRALDACPEDKRSWEWRYLSRLVDQSDRAVACLPPGTSQMCVDSTTGRVFASQLDGDIKALDGGSGEVVFELRRPAGGASAIGVRPVESELAIGDSQGSIDVYRANEREPHRTIKSHESPIHVIRFTRDGERALTIGDDGVLRSWDLPSWTARGEIQCEATSGEFSPDGGAIATCGPSGAVNLWDASSGALVRSMPGHEGPIRALAFSADGARLVSAGEDSSVRVWNVSDGSLASISRVHANKVTAVAISADGGLVASGGTDSTVRIIDAGTGKELRRMLGHGATVTGIAFSGDESRIISCGRDGVVRWWSVSEGNDEWRPGIGLLLNMARSPDGRRIAVAGGAHAASVYEIETGREVMRTQGPAPSVTRAIGFSRDGSRLYTGGADHAVVAWDAATGAEAERLMGHAGWPLSVAAASASDRIVTGATDSTALVWEAGESTPSVRLTGHEDAVTCLAWTPDDARVISGSKDGTIRIWDAQTGRCEKTMRAAEGRGSHVHCLVLNEAGDAVIYGLENGVAEMRRLSTWEVVRTFEGHKGGVLSLDLEPRTLRLASGGFDNTVRIWDLRDGSDLVSLQGHLRMVLGVRFSGDGSRLISIAEATARVWRADQPATREPGQAGGQGR